MSQRRFLNDSEAQAFMDAVSNLGELNCAMKNFTTPTRSQVKYFGALINQEFERLSDIVKGNYRRGIHGEAPEAEEAEDGR